MTRLLLSEEASSDAEQILSYLYHEAGPHVAERYERRFKAMLERLEIYPESGAPRPALGVNCRIAIVSPYVLIYDFLESERLSVVLRILHGHRAMHERMLGR